MCDNGQNGILLTGVGRVSGRPVRIQADLRNDHFPFRRRDVFLQELLHGFYTLLGGIQTEVRGSAKTERDLPGIHLRKKLATDARKEQKGARKEQRHGHDEFDFVYQTPIQRQ